MGKRWKKKKMEWKEMLEKEWGRGKFIYISNQYTYIFVGLFRFFLEKKKKGRKEKRQ